MLSWRGKGRDKVSGTERRVWGQQVKYRGKSPGVGCHLWVSPVGLGSAAAAPDLFKLNAVSCPRAPATKKKPALKVCW